MGFATAAEFAEHAPSMEIAVLCHLQSNCFPPVPSVMVTPAVAAIEAYQDRDHEREVELPEGVAFRDGQTVVEAHEIVDSLRLDAFTVCDEF